MLFPFAARVAVIFFAIATLFFSFIGRTVFFAGSFLCLDPTRYDDEWQLLQYEPKPVRLLRLRQNRLASRVPHIGHFGLGVCVRSFLAVLEVLLLLVMLHLSYVGVNRGSVRSPLRLH